MIKTFFWLVFLAGLVGGPGYWTYINYFTGSSATVLDLQRDAEGRLVSPSFTLNPAQSPVGVEFQGTAKASTGGDRRGLPVPRFQAILQQDGKAADPLKFSLRPNKNPGADQVFNERLLLLTVSQPATYQLQLEPLSAPQPELANPQIELHHQVQVADARIVTIGIVMAAMGLLLLLIL